MKSKNTSAYAHRSDSQDIENFYKIISGEKKIGTQREKEEVEASYFAMCLLLPKQNFLKTVKYFGGIESVKSNCDKKNCIARMFNVESRLVETRINDLLEQSNQKKKEKTKSKIIPFSKK